MAFDFKKEYKEFYMPGNKPDIVTMPIMTSGKIEASFEMSYIINSYNIYYRNKLNQ